MARRRPSGLALSPSSCIISCHLRMVTLFPTITQCIPPPPPPQRPLNVLLTPRAMQLVNLCLILVSTGALLLADALRSTQPQVAQVLLATGVGLAVYTVTFSHAFLGRLFHPSYRVFQPFIGGRYYVLLQVQAPKRLPRPLSRAGFPATPSLFPILFPLLDAPGRVDGSGR
ncbi:hypothetical protein T492DRAFT_306730 [Pavlovales sp. CCMP2436]|nr:hypothetical protein T492DRAFT_306730 [Pavlovales sp. CCMP2436]